MVLTFSPNSLPLLEDVKTLGIQPKYDRALPHLMYYQNYLSIYDFR